ncbi:hypothetical protein [Nisaea nitritireducens]|uniref:hypothetical protein n=1 Tax=Nisaea nitritireducens TaxID=568392 RepID=UPI00186778F7|nr:hypothetical protein [Nisaea nitritireducens]
MPTEQTSVTFPSASKLDLGINLTEDRLVMVAHTAADGVRAMLLTRRMLVVLMDHYGNLLKQTSPAAKAQQEHQDEILQMEHIGALFSNNTASESAPTGQQQPAPIAFSLEAAYLVTEVTLQMNENHLVIGFSGLRLHASSGDDATVTPVAAFNLDRTNAHKVLALLNDKAREAGWGLDTLYPWLNNSELVASEQRPVN